MLRGAAVLGGLVRVFVAQLVEAEFAAFDDLDAARDRVFIAAKQPRHFRRRFQMALGIGGEAEAGFADRAACADAGQHILQRPPLGGVIEHVVGRDQRQPRHLGQRREAGEAARIVAAIEMMGGEIGAVSEIDRDAGGKSDEFLPSPPTGKKRVGVVRRQHDDDLALAMRDNIGIVETAFALGRAAFA